MLVRVRVSASKPVYAHAFAWKTLTSKFHRELLTARTVQRKAHETAADSGEAILARVHLGRIAEELGKEFKKLESAIRRETTM
jgi:hypothetical protein